MRYVLITFAILLAFGCYPPTIEEQVRAKHDVSRISCLRSDTGGCDAMQYTCDLDGVLHTCGSDGSCIEQERLPK